MIMHHQLGLVKPSCQIFPVHLFPLDLLNLNLPPPPPHSITLNTRISVFPIFSSFSFYPTPLSLMANLSCSIIDNFIYFSA